ncbi:GspE/PulE family protein [Microbaculum sp. FT89]|uniref:GspE/PulE family protein n=1 Tax=Microbaculum sp. FT89 TaxID=3447298 RepID=UPI003F53184A
MIANEVLDVDGTFTAFLKNAQEFSERVDWAALSKLDASERGSYAQLWEAGILTGTDLADAISAFHGLPRGRTESVTGKQHGMKGLSRRFLRDAWVYPFEKDGHTALAVADPTNEDAIRAVSLALGATPMVYVVAFEDIAMLFERDVEQTSEADQTAAAAAQAGEIDGESTSDENLERLRDLARGAPVVQAVDAMLEAAIDLNATDIHIEPSRDAVRVRLRVDGFLRPYQNLPSRMARAIVSRIKILAGLNIAERRLPQDGRARVKIVNTEADLRIATMPTLHGEAAVIRILVKESRALDLARLGMSQHDLKALRTQLAEPYGMIVVTGPTGSGKTTTLAAALTYLNDPQRKIMTVEDPIEYQVPGIHQTQIKPSIDLTFATALRSFLRHDPDIIMVGEMRDSETASIGIQAALTGHLVLTTLHTNNAADAVARLLDLKVESFLLASALRCVVGQRLVRRLCERCRQPAPPGDATTESLIERGVLTLAPGESLFVGGGCDWCGGTGYRGRIAIFEVMKFDAQLRKNIHDDVDTAELQRLSHEAGMTSMLEDGLAKCRAGLTSVAEVVRVTT